MEADKELIRIDDTDSRGKNGSGASADKSPLITLIIPVYNVERYLRQCLDSAAAQTCDNLRVIIVDDGSTDDSGAVCDEYAAACPRFTVFHTPNGGLAAARNQGLCNMDPLTKYVAFLDSDDWLEPDALQRLRDAAEECGADIVACDYYVETPEGRQPAHPASAKATLTGNEKLRLYLKNRDVLNGLAWNKLYKAELFEGVRYPEDIMKEDDLVTCRLIHMAQRVALLPDALIHYRMRQSSISRNHNARWRTDCWRVVRDKYEELSELISDEECLRLLESDCFTAIFAMWVSLGGFTREERQSAKPALEEMKRFAGERRRKILSSRQYPKAVKRACIAAACDNALFLRLLNRLFGLSRRQKRVTMFP
ncbi:MAG: glycosyltransferase [Abditibacteriota bacterium]|nr:glycosyltransferase [Abditibacteriota bacterium]